MTNLSKRIEMIEKGFDDKYIKPYEQIKELYKKMTDSMGINSEYQESFTDILVRMEEVKKLTRIKYEYHTSIINLLADVRKDIEEYYGHVLNDGSGKPMNITIEEILNDILTLLEIGDVKKTGE